MIDESSQGLALAGTGGLDQGRGLAAGAPKIAEGTRVECLFKDPEESADAGAWFAGVVESQNEDGSWKIKFDDGDQDNFMADDPDLRLESSGPWATWLDTYLPGLLLSAYRAYRRDPYQVEPRFFSMVHNPEQFCDSADSEFQPRNFCDVVRLCDVVNLCDDAESIAETPAKASNPERKRRRP